MSDIIPIRKEHANGNGAPKDLRERDAVSEQIVERADTFFDALPDDGIYLFVSARTCDAVTIRLDWTTNVEIDDATVTALEKKIGEVVTTLLGGGK